MDTTKRRLLYLARILYEETDSKHFLTTNQLRKILMDRYGIDAHRQTIPDDVKALREIGIDIKEYLGTNKRYWIENRIFETAEVKLLMDAVNSAKFIPKNQSRELEQKLLTQVSNYEAEGLIRNVSVERRIKRDNKHIYEAIDTINEAINLKRKIAFQYFTFNIKKRPVLRNNGESYIISPHQLVWNGDFYYLVGVNDYNEMRIFRIDRMMDCPRVLEEKLRGLPKGFSMSKFLNTTFRMYGTDYTSVTLLCANDVVDSILDRFGRSTVLEPTDEDFFRITVDVAVSNVFYGWVFGFGGKVKIEGPEDTIKEYKQMVNNAMNQM